MKLLVYAAATGGFIYWARQSHLMRQFRHVRDIPWVYVERHIRLRGVVTAVTPGGVLSVRHKPVIPVERWLGLHDRPDASAGVLQVRLAGLHLGQAATPWMQKSLINTTVWCQLIRKADNSDLVDASVTASRPVTYGPLSFKNTGLGEIAGSKRPMLYNLNRDLISRGYAGTVDACADGEHNRAVRTTPAYARLLNQLQLTSRADRSEMASEVQESVVSVPEQIQQIVHNSALYQIMLLGVWALYTCLRVLVNLTYSLAAKSPQARKRIDKLLKSIEQLKSRLFKTQKKRYL